MITAYDVSADLLIKNVSQHLKIEIEPPTWAFHVKTGQHKELQPVQPDWWYIRCASILRKIYFHGPIGTERLRSAYGGKIDNGVKPAHHVKGSGSIARKAVQQLESVGYLEKCRDGRRISVKGRSFLDRIAFEAV